MVLKTNTIPVIVECLIQWSPVWDWESSQTKTTPQTCISGLTLWLYIMKFWSFDAVLRTNTITINVEYLIQWNPSWDCENSQTKTTPIWRPYFPLFWNFCVRPSVSLLQSACRPASLSQVCFLGLLTTVCLYSHLSLCLCVCLFLLLQCACLPIGLSVLFCQSVSLKTACLSVSLSASLTHYSLPTFLSVFHNHRLPVFLSVHLSLLLQPPFLPVCLPVWVSCSYYTLPVFLSVYLPHYSCLPSCLSPCLSHYTLHASLFVFLSHYIYMSAKFLFVSLSHYIIYTLPAFLYVYLSHYICLPSSCLSPCLSHYTLPAFLSVYLSHNSRLSACLSTCLSYYTLPAFLSGLPVPLQPSVSMPSCLSPSLSLQSDCLPVCLGLAIHPSFIVSLTACSHQRRKWWDISTAGILAS